jgi:endonuclease/exonuclease/phosphatase family metal-dependent hydrolase
MPVVRVASVNILSDLSKWEERRPVLLAGLEQARPDLLALQEVNLRENTAAWLAAGLGWEHLALRPKTGRAGKKEGIAILSRWPFSEHASLDLQSQGRVAQLVRLSVAGRPFTLVNGHFHWQPGRSPERLRQVERLLGWLEPLRSSLPVIVCGDYNAGPQDAALQKMREKYRSAFADRHGREPEYTYPTPLPRSKLALLRTLVEYWRDLRPSALRVDLHATLDFIFVNERVSVQDCRLFLDRPAPGAPKLYASDHFGLLAVVEI